MKRSVYNNVLAKVSLAPVARDSDGVFAGTTIDLAEGLNNARTVGVLVQTGSVTDGSHAITLQESDNGTDWTTCTDLQGSAPTLTSTSDSVVLEFGYSPRARYLRVVSTVTGSTDGGLYAALILMGGMRRTPVAHPIADPEPEPEGSVLRSAALGENIAWEAPDPLYLNTGTGFYVEDGAGTHSAVLLPLTEGVSYVYAPSGGGLAGPGLSALLVVTGNDASTFSLEDVPVGSVQPVTLTDSPLEDPETMFAGNAAALASVGITSEFGGAVVWYEIGHDPFTVTEA